MAINKNSKIAVLLGGLSSEREVSLRSGENVYKALIELGYKNVKKVDMKQDGVKELINGKYDAAYNALHGKYGEDGCVQGVLEYLKIPYTGPGVKSSAICLDKDITKKVLEAHNIPTLKSCSISKKEDLETAFNELEFPLMVKPASEGSSIGMSKVKNYDELKAAFDIAKEKDGKILIEEYKNGISATVGVLEKEGEIFATPILEFKTKTEWYDYEAKYTKGLTEFILPACFDRDLTSQIKQIAKDAFRACECSGVSRVDFLVTDNKPYVLEVNTSPGMTDLSDLPHQAQSMGISYNELVDMILKTAGLNK